MPEDDRGQEAAPADAEPKKEHKEVPSLKDFASKRKRNAQRVEAKMDTKTLLIWVLGVAAVGALIVVAFVL